MGKGGGKADEEGGHDGIGSGIVRGEGGKMGNSCAPRVKDGMGFPGPQYESSALVPWIAVHTCLL
jgi:hypothetical protein